MNIITGTGRSGTSVTARILLAAGHNVGATEYIEEPLWAGHERADLATLNNRMIAEMRERGLVFPDPAFTAEMVEAHGHRMRELIAPDSWPKDPRVLRLLPIWHEAVGLERVMLCVRHVPHAWRSAQLARTAVHEHGPDDSAAALGYALAWLEHEMVDYVVLPYPEIVENREVFLERVAPFLDITEDLLEAYDSVVDPRLVHVRTEEVPA